MQETSPRKHRGLLIKLGLVLLVGIVAVVLLLRGVDIRGWATRTMEFVRAAGPLTFFTGMALLPAVGFPVLPFCVAAGPAFGQQLGLGGILLCSAAAVLVNILLTYWLARFAFRPVLERWLIKMGYRIPKVDTADQWELTLLVRITPGPPFFVQSYLLGLAQIPFGIYILPSFLAPMINITGFVIFGDALAQGKGKWALGGILLVIAAGVAVQFLRKKLARRKAATAVGVAGS